MLSCHSLPSYTWNRVAALEKLRPTRQLSTNKRRPFVFAVRGGIDIDRRAFFNQQLCRQLEAEAIEAEAEISCPIHCVREVQSHREFEKVLNDAQEHNKLVVLDFYNTSCGSCKYILPQFIKLCKKGCGEECMVDDDLRVVFVKHNIRDQYDELTDLARFYSIRSVPMFSFFMDGCRVEQFPTRDKHRLHNTIFL
ncbi:hypothetical protein SUGI_0581500 [Cryptomeria japonica]|nr:hypothetical protein SUGI_0581500 [Cryptomeria japonica]